MSGILAPRLLVLSGGAALPAPVSASVTSNSYYHASEFELRFAASSAAGGWWDVAPPWVVEVQVSTDGIGYTPLLTGEVDSVDFDLATLTVALAGRDFTAALIEAKTQESFQNQTASEIAKTIAARHNLAAEVAPTTTLAGTFYQQDHVRTSLGQFARARTEWDILTYLAQHEGFDVWIDGRTLFFQPQAQPGSPDFTIAVSTTPAGAVVANVEQLRCLRALTLAKDIQVEVHSWNSRQQRGFTRSARAIGAKVAAIQKASNQVGTTTQRYVFVRPNLTEDQALQFARAMLEQIGRQERNIEVEMPGETLLSPRSQIALTGTATSFDQIYWVDRIHRQVTMQGFRQSLRLKNHSPLSQVVLS